jgi:hypothetical protein
MTKTPRRAAWAVFFAFVGCACPAVEETRSRLVIEWVGVLKAGDQKERYAISGVDRAGHRGFIGWFALGQQAGDYRLVEFDSVAEVLIVADAQEVRRKLRLRDAAMNAAPVDWAKVVPATREEARASAVAFIAYAMAHLPKVDSDVKVQVDTDGSLMPAHRKEAFLAMRASAEAEGRFCVAFAVDGEWTSLVSAGREFAIPKAIDALLSAADRDDFRYLVVCTMAEWTARNSAAKRRKAQ